MRIARREVLRMGVGLGICGLVPDAWAHTNIFPAAFPVVVDSSVNCGGIADRLKRLGVKVVVRYYALKYQSHLPEKILQQHEADAILGAGLSLLISYQYNNGSLSTFTAERGALDARKCLSKAHEIGQPKGSAIYFGVDAGWDDRASIGKVIDYFEAINKVVAENGNPFEVAAYGSGLMCSRLRKEGLTKYSWIAGLSDGWPGRANALKQGDWNLFQNALEVGIGGVRVDTNVVNPAAGSGTIGSFHGPGTTGPNVLDGPIDNHAVCETQLLVKGEYEAPRQARRRLNQVAWRRPDGYKSQGRRRLGRRDRRPPSDQEPRRKRRRLRARILQGDSLVAIGQNPL